MLQKSNFKNSIGFLIFSHWIYLIDNEVLENRVTRKLEAIWLLKLSLKSHTTVSKSYKEKILYPFFY